MTLTTPAPRSRTYEPSTTTVVLHCGSAPAGQVERRLKTVLRTVPESVRVVATVTRSLRLHASTARRVDVRVIHDGGEELLRSLVAAGGPVAVLPHGATPAQNWLTRAEDLSEQFPGRAGVAPWNDGFFFYFPADVGSLGAPRTQWPIHGLVEDRPSGAGRAARPPVRRSLDAVLIVKDEERNLPSCLAALENLVDTVIVYDTGSRDSTAATAAALGAQVVEGYWDDDFSAARNRALRHSTADWILSVDADEIVEAEGAALRSWVDATDVLLAQVSIVSSAWGEDAGHESRSVRLFQRQGAAWEGALHEQLRVGDAVPRSDAAAIPPLRLRHSGYEIAAAHAKRGRNSGIVRKQLDALPAGASERPDLLAHLARSLMFEGDVPSARSAAAEVLALPGSPGNMVQLARVMVPIHLGDGDLETAEQWAAAAQGGGEAPGACAVWQATLECIRGDLDAARAILEPLADGTVSGGCDLWGVAFNPATAGIPLAEVEAHLGDVEAAARRLQFELKRSPHQVPISVVIRLLGAVGWTLGDLMSSAPQAFLDRSLREVVLFSPAVALPWFAAMAEVAPDDPRPVVAGSIVAAMSGWRDAAEWEVFARERGVDGVEPLRVLAGDPRVPSTDRAVAWALLHEGFGAEGALEDLAELLLTAPETVDAVRAHVPTALTGLGLR